MQVRITRSARCKRTVVVMIAALAASTMPAPDARSSRCAVATERNHFGTWTTIPLPETPRATIDEVSAAFPQKSTRNVVHAYAVDPNDPAVLYAADESTVMRSTDGGCTWGQTFSVLDGGEAAPQTDHIVSLTAVAVSPRATRVYAVLRHGAQWFSHKDLSGSGPRLAVLDETGEWTVHDPVLAGSGAPLVGEATRLLATPGPAGILYMRVNDFTQSGPALYASEDGGRSWELRGVREFVTPSQGGPAQTCAAPSVCTGVDYRVLAVDPVEPNVLWSATQFGILRSDDGGRSWRILYAVDWTPRLIDVHHPVGEPARIAVFGALRRDLWSSDGGKTWRAVSLRNGGDALASAASGRSRDELVHVDMNGRAQLATPKGARDVSLRAHGRSADGSWDKTRTRLLDATYVPAARSYFFIGGDNRDFRWFGKSIVSFTPRPSRRGTAR
jgi:photosystem II stability/assembly factor-like uncharacterized protein